MGKILVPSDVTILEEKYCKGCRLLTFMERIGLLGMPRMYHINYAKNDRKDKRRILSRLYETEPTTPIDVEVLDILTTRQQSIRKSVLRNNYQWGGVFAMTMFTWISLRHYDYKTKSITLPLAMYGGSFIGKWAGDLLLGRWSEYDRDRFLGSLPSKRFLTCDKTLESSKRCDKK